MAGKLRFAGTAALAALVALSSITTVADEWTQGYAPQTNIARFNPTNQLNVATAFARSPMLTGTRGVLMQAEATFLIGEEEIDPGQVRFEVRDDKGQSRLCLRIGSADCALLYLEDAHVAALAQFVRNGRHAAFSLPGNGPDPAAISEFLETLGMVPVRPLAQYRNDQTAHSYIAGELDTPFFQRVFRFIDYDHPFAFPDFWRDWEQADAVAVEMNTVLGHAALPTGVPEDATYVNADFHAAYVATTIEGYVGCAGLPARYHWSLHPGAQTAFIEAVEWAAVPPTDKGKALAQDAQNVFCVTAILRAMHAADPSSIVLP